MATNLKVYINTGNVDVEYGASGGEFVEMDLANDYFVFSSGSDVVADGLAIPSQAELNRAGVLLTGIQQIVGKYFLADVSANVLREIPLMGNTTGRYVIAFEFDNGTASEPVLELWDDSSLNTIDGTTLGAGTASNSWWRGITTTNGAPGTSWVGTILAGSSDNHFLYLNDNNGPLGTADVLYANLKIIIPASATTGLSSTPVLVAKFASN